jgi:membrane protease subunit HflC
MAMDDLVSTEPGKEAGATRVEDKMAYLRSQLLDALRGPLRKDYGIQLVDLRLRRFSYPGNVREEIYRRIRSERQKIVTEYESEGDRKAKDIETKAEETKRDLLAKAKFEEDKLRGKAETEAMVIRNEAHQQDPEFYDFLNRMGKLQNILADNKTVLLLSTHRPLFDLLFQPPRPGLKGPPPTNKDEKSLKKEDKNSKAAGGSK